MGENVTCDLMGFSMICITMRFADMFILFTGDDKTHGIHLMLI